MDTKILTKEIMKEFKNYLISEEKSSVTIDKYCRDVERFYHFLDGRCVTKEIVILYKKDLMEHTYAVASINSMLASINSLFEFMGWQTCKVKNIKLQKQIYCAKEKELSKTEYVSLLNAAKKKGNERLYLMLQTICATGLRVSELQYITVEAVKSGKTVVSCKSKVRYVFIVKGLRKKLMQYAKAKNIESGPIFVTRTGNAMNRSNIWREMKKLCEEAGVEKNKVFPHNLRHLFARTFYKVEKDIAKLADILGHSSINTTRIYMVSSGEEHQKCMELMHLLV